MDNFTIVSKKIEAKGASTFEGLAEDSEISFLTGLNILGGEPENFTVADLINIILPKQDLSKFMVRDQVVFHDSITNNINSIKTRPIDGHLFGLTGLHVYPLEMYIKRFAILPTTGEQFYGHMTADITNVGKKIDINININVGFNDFKNINIAFGIADIPDADSVNTVTINFLDKEVTATIDDLTGGNAFSVVGLIKDGNTVKFVFDFQK